MAMTINVATKPGRGDFFSVNPDDVLMRSEDRNRFREPSDEKVLKLAESMLKRGQLEPVLGRKVENDRVMVYCGFTRTAAARLIREGFTDSQGIFQHDPDFMLKIIVSIVNEQEATLRSIAENEDRIDLSPMDKATQQAKLRERYLKTNEEIAEVYGCNKATVARLERLLGLADEYQEMVHDGRLTIQAALDLLELPEDQHKAVVSKTLDDEGRVNTTGVRRLVRERHLNDDEKLQSELDGPDESRRRLEDRKNRSKARTVVEVKSFCKKLTASPSASLARLGVFLEEFCDGKCTDEDMEARLKKLFGGDVEAPTQAVVFKKGKGQVAETAAA